MILSHKSPDRLYPPYIYLFGHKWEHAVNIRSGDSPGGRVNRTYSKPFFDVEKPFSFSGSVVKAAKSENKKGFSTSEKARITRLPG